VQQIVVDNASGGDEVQGCARRARRPRSSPWTQVFYRLRDDRRGAAA
jgi:hypothetical protein